MRTLIRDLIFTPNCIGCAVLGQAVCSDCLEKLSIVKNHQIPQIDSLVCASDYSSWLRDRVIQYKSGNYELGRALAQVLLEKCLIEFGNYPIVPIPSSIEKQQLRQIDTIGQIVKKIKLLDPKYSINPNLFLIRPVMDQVGLSKLERQRNVADAFAAKAKLTGSVILIDDVVTTGATISAAAKALKGAGAIRVFAAGLCAATQLS